MTPRGSGCGGEPGEVVRAQVAPRREVGVPVEAAFHGTDSSRLGFGSSDGCVLMAVPDVVDLYARVRLNTPVIVR